MIRFRKTEICSLYNQLDVLNLEPKPRRNFSLSAVEMRLVRAVAGHFDNVGPGVAEALSHVRRLATPDYERRLALALDLGVVYAREWMAIGAERVVAGDVGSR